MAVVSWRRFDGGPAKPVGFVGQGAHRSVTAAARTHSHGRALSQGSNWTNCVNLIGDGRELHAKRLSRCQESCSSSRLDCSSAQLSRRGACGRWFPRKKKKKSNLKVLQGHQGVMFRVFLDPPMRTWSLRTSGRACCNLVGSSPNS